MSDIRTVLDRLIVIQAAVAITDPSVQDIKTAWKYIAPQNTTIPETPCFMNAFNDRGWEAGPGFRIRNYTIQSVIYVQDADIEVGLDIAAALYVQYQNDLGLDMDLSDNVNGGITLRGADPTIGTFDRSGKKYAGCELFLDFQIKDAFAWATVTP